MHSSTRASVARSRVLSYKPALRFFPLSAPAAGVSPDKLGSLPIVRPICLLGGNTIRTRHHCAGPCWCIRQVDVPVGSRPAPGPPAELVPSRWRLVPRHRGDVPTADLASSCAGPCLPQPSLGLAPKLWPRPLLASFLHALDRCLIKSARHPASAP